MLQIDHIIKGLHQRCSGIYLNYETNIFTHTAGPKEVPSVLQHCIDIDQLSLSDGDEPAVSGVVVLHCTSNQNGICAGITGRVQ